MTPKIRSPFVSWLLTVCTAGIYFLFWVRNVANELNGAEGKVVLNVIVWRQAFVIVFCLSIGAFAWLVTARNPGSILFFLSVFMVTLGLFIHVQYAIGRYIIAKDIELNTGASFSNAMSIFLFWLVANTGIAYMQAGINRVIEQERNRSW